MIVFERTTRLLKRDLVQLIASAQDLGVCRNALHSFAKYMKSDFDEEMESYKTVAPDLSKVNLETLLPVQYRVLVRNQDLKSLEEFITKIGNSPDEFKGNESTYRVMVSFYTLYSMIVVKLVTTWASTVSTMYYNDNTLDVNNVFLDKIGIDKSTLRFYDLMIELRSKSLDDWKAIKIPADEERYIGSIIKRVFYILGF